MNTTASNKSELIATEVTVRDGHVFLRLLDGSTHSFPIHYYPRLVNAAAEDLVQVRLRVGGRALRWDALDEDIWIYDAVVGRYPVACAS
ncbi:MAG: DUF2442 domain-containing protein [Opitutus sp.]|nr:DUF2442 domain-containing protein [Opitutus sp.]MCS6273788.1 DUF2442 domain-containing protein [Opitutus sp.]MCS6277659.1 DUF2442 domain-containing protein [Opitutus sp.]MCS6300777.1 DUF2442 domain-containing protein [Opitutus sp.]